MDVSEENIWIGGAAVDQRCIAGAWEALLTDSCLKLLGLAR